MSINTIFDDVLQVVTKKDKSFVSLYEKVTDKKQSHKIDININTPTQKKEQPKEKPVEPAEPLLPSLDPNQAADPMMPQTDPSLDPSLDPNMQAGMQDPNEILDPEVLGKVFILKKMYVRLITLDDRLQHMLDRKYDQIKKDTIEMIELYHNIILKFDLFKDKIDDIIKITQKFLLTACNKLDSME